jgi:hypothetical protein
MRPFPALSRRAGRSIPAGGWAAVVYGAETRTDWSRDAAMLRHRVKPGAAHSHTAPEQIGGG